MSNQRRVIIGDIHGAFDELQQLLKKINYNPDKDQLISVGDMVDRGDKPREVVQYIKQYGEAVGGNHEDKMLRWLKWELSKKKNPCKEPSKNRKKQWLSFSDDELDWLRSLPAYIKLPFDWLVVHGGMEPKYSLEKQDPKKMMRIRFVNEEGVMVSIDKNLEQPVGSFIWTKLYNDKYNIVHGHFVRSMGFPIIENSINNKEIVSLDTGACFGGKLSALIFIEDKYNIVQVDCKNYKELDN